MSALADLHAAVLADLDAEAPRLVLADALQAAGDPRGELIAVQCELARHGCDRTRVALWGTPPDYHYKRSLPNPRRQDWIGDGLATADTATLANLRKRERALVTEHGERWTRGLRAGFRFARGFVEHAFTGFDGKLADIFAAAPHVRSLESTIRDGLDIVMADPHAGQLQQLRYSFLAPNHAVTRFIGGAQDAMPALRELAISGLNLGAHPDDHDGAGVPLERFAASPLLRQLEALDLYGQAMDRVERLDPILAAAPLRDLRLGANLVDGRGTVAALTKSPHLAALEILDLYGTHADRGFEALMPQLANLRALRLVEANRSMDEAARAIAELPRLQILDLSYHHPPLHLDRLVDGRGLGELAHLRLGSCQLTETTVKDFATSALFGRLRTLDLTGNELTDASVLQLAPSERLELLDLRVNKVTPACKRTLVERFPNARILAGKSM